MSDHSQSLESISPDTSTEDQQEFPDLVVRDLDAGDEPYAGNNVVQPFSHPNSFFPEEVREFVEIWLPIDQALQTLNVGVPLLTSTPVKLVIIEPPPAPHWLLDVPVPAEGFTPPAMTPLSDQPYHFGVPYFSDALHAGRYS
jgi:hypothetical protein